MLAHFRRQIGEFVYELVQEGSDGRAGVTAVG